MNKVYRVIWNASLGAWVAVSEITKSKGKKSNKAIKSGVLVSSLVLFAGNAIAASYDAGGGSATGSESVAIGDGATSQGIGSVAMGQYAKAVGTNTTAIGSGTTADGNDATAVGNNAQAIGMYSTAVGNLAKANEKYSTALGYEATAEAVRSTAIGMKALVKGVGATDSFAIGNGTLVTGKYSVALGQEVKVNGSYSSAVGYMASADGSGSVAIGTQAETSGGNSAALGNSAKASGIEGLALGNAAEASGRASNAMGYNAKATAQNATAIGSNAKADGVNATAIGDEAKANQDFSNALGYKAEANGSGSAAIGAWAKTSGVDSAALGNHAEASGSRSLALGNAAAASGSESLALGNSAAASGSASNAIGWKANAKGQNATAIGSGATADGKDAVVLGTNSFVQDTDSIAIGRGATVNSDKPGISQNSIAFGANAKVKGGNSTALGANTDTGDGAGMLAIGDNASTNNKTVGSATYSANNNQSVALGSRAQAWGDQAIAIGGEVKASGNSSVAIGGDDIDRVRYAYGNLYKSITGQDMPGGYRSTESSGAGATAIGVMTTASGHFASALGMTADASGDGAVAIGPVAKSSGESGVAIGIASQASAKKTIAIGSVATAKGENATAIGGLANAANYNATAIGSETQAIADYAQAMGYQSKASGIASNAIGWNANATAQNATAIGSGAKAYSRSGIAMGSNAEAGSVGSEETLVQAMALGTNSKAKAQSKDVALGADSETSTVANTQNTQIDGKTYTYAGTNAKSTLSVGKSGAERTITNVAAGRISGTSTDAINGSQLYGTNQAINSLAGDVDTLGNATATAIGGNSTYNPSNHTVSVPTYNINNQNVSTVSGAINKLNEGWNLTSNGNNTAAVRTNDTVDIGTATGETNLIVAKNGNTIDYSLNKNLDLGTTGSVKTGNTTVNNAGLIVTDGGSNVKTTVGSGNIAVTNGTNTVTMNGGTGTVTGLTNTNLTDPSFATSKRAATEEQLKALGDKGFKISAKNTAGTDDVALGETVKFTNTDDNLVATYGNNEITYNLAKALKVDSVNAGGTVINNNGLSFVDANGATLANTPSIKKDGINAGGQQIANVASGGNTSTNAANIGDVQKAAAAAKSVVVAGTNVASVSPNVDSNTGATTYTVNAKGTNVTGSNAVTVTQGGPDANNVTNYAVDLSQTSKNSLVKADTAVQSLTTAANGANAQTLNQSSTQANFKDGKNIKVTGDATGITIATADEVTFDKVTVDGVVVDGGKITGLSAGNVSPTSSDAVNGSQLYKTSSSVANALGGGSVVNPDGTVKAPTYTVNNAAVNNVGDAIKALDKGWTVNSNGKLGAGTAVKAGDSVDIGVADDEKNITVAAKTEDGMTVIDFALAKDLKVDSVNAGGTVINNNGLSFVDSNGATLANTPSIKKTGIDAGSNKITNVAAGDVSTTSKDAINGSQLNTVKETAEKGWNFTATNGSATSAADTVKPGETLDFANTDGNIGITSADNKLTFNLAKDIKVDSVTAGDTVVNNNGITIVGGPSVTKTGINAGDKKITNVLAGDVNDASKDAVNGSQLYKTSSSVANALGGGSVVNPDGTVKAPSYTVNNAAVNNVGDAIKALDKGWTVNADGKLGAGQAVKAGDSVDIGVADEEKNITVAAKTKDGKTVIDFALAKDLKVDSVNAGGTVINNNGLSFVDSNGATLANTPSIKKTGIDAGSNKITNVAAGDVSTTSKDAINGSQLNTVKETAEKGWNFTATNGSATSAADTVKPGETLDFANTDGNIGITSRDNKLTFNLAKDIKVDSVTAGDTVVNNNGITIVGGPSVTKTGINAGDKKITNVLAGDVNDASKDAVNGSQLYALGTGVQNIIGGNTTYDPTTGTYVNNNIGNTGKNNINDAIASVNDAATKAKTTVTQGDNIVVTPTPNADGSSNYKVAVANDLNVNSVTSNVVTVGSVKIDKTHVDAAGKTIISGVGKGELSSTSTDAVNGSQLYATNQKVTQNTTDITNINTTLDKGLNFSADSGTTVNRKLGDTVAITGDKNIVTTTTANGVQIKLSDNIDVNNVNVSQSITVAEGATVNMGGNVIQNVGAGVNGTDAVNVNQLNSVASNINNRITTVGNIANAGVAQAIATAGLPQAYLPGKNMMAIAGGTYEGEAGYAIGFSTISDNGKWIIKATGSGNSRGKFGASIGAGYQW